jgi:hypothetical protein
MGRPRSSNKKRLTRYRVNNRGAFARHLQAQVDNDGNNLDLLKTKDDVKKSDSQPFVRKLTPEELEARRKRMDEMRWSQTPCSSPSDSSS